MQWRKASRPTGKVIITGTGRAGTTLLMRIFIRLGLPTGFTVADIAAVEQMTGRAGLECDFSGLDFRNLPEIVKSPYLSDLLHDALQQNQIVVDQIIVPIRDLDQATNSRVRVSARAREKGADPLDVAGGMWETTDPEQQKNVLAQKVYALTQTATQNRIPIVFLSFPDFARDVAYFVETLGPFLKKRYAISQKQLRAAHAQEVRLNFIGDHVS